MVTKYELLLAVLEYTDGVYLLVVGLERDIELETMLVEYEYTEVNGRVEEGDETCVVGTDTLLDDDAIDEDEK